MNFNENNHDNLKEKNGTPFFSLPGVYRVQKARCQKFTNKTYTPASFLSYAPRTTKTLPSIVASEPLTASVSVGDNHPAFCTT